MTLITPVVLNAPAVPLRQAILWCAAPCEGDRLLHALVGPVWSIRIGDRSCLERHIDDLSDAGFSDIMVVVDGTVALARAALGNRGRWSSSITIVDRSTEHSRNLATLLSLAGHGDAMERGALPVLRADRLCEAYSHRLCDVSVGHRIVSGDVLLGLMLGKDGAQTLNDIAALIDYRRGSETDIGLLDACPIGTAPGIVTAAGRLAAGWRPGFDTFGVAASMLGGPSETWVGPGCALAEGIVPDTEGRHTVLGSRCCVRAGATLRGRCVLGDDVVVDRDAVLEDVLVLPGTYVGRDVKIHRAIIAGNRVLPVGASAITTVPDPSVLAPLHH